MQGYAKGGSIIASLRRRRSNHWRLGLLKRLKWLNESFMGAMLVCRAPAQTAVLVKRLRQALDAMWRERWERRSEAAAGSTLISTIVDLLNHEEAARKWDR
jgi:hypothetical protein